MREETVLPRMVVKMRRAVRHLSRGRETEPSGAQNEASWQRMLSALETREGDLEYRLAEAERALNRLGSF